MEIELNEEPQKTINLIDGSTTCMKKLSNRKTPLSISLDEKKSQFYISETPASPPFLHLKTVNLISDCKSGSCDVSLNETLGGEDFSVTINGNEKSEKAKEIKSVSNIGYSSAEVKDFPSVKYQTRIKKDKKHINSTKDIHQQTRFLDKMQVQPGFSSSSSSDLHSSSFDTINRIDADTPLQNSDIHQYQTHRKNQQNQYHYMDRTQNYVPYILNKDNNSSSVVQNQQNISFCANQSDQSNNYPSNPRQLQPKINYIEKNLNQNSYRDQPEIFQQSLESTHINDCSQKLGINQFQRDCLIYKDTNNPSKVLAQQRIMGPKIVFSPQSSHCLNNIAENYTNQNMIKKQNVHNFYYKNYDQCTPSKFSEEHLITNENKSGTSIFKNSQPSSNHNQNIFPFHQKNDFYNNGQLIQPRLPQFSKCSPPLIMRENINHYETFVDTGAFEDSIYKQDFSSNSFQNQQLKRKSQIPNKNRIKIKQSICDQSVSLLQPVKWGNINRGNHIIHNNRENGYLENQNIYESSKPELSSQFFEKEHHSASLRSTSSPISRNHVSLLEHDNTNTLIVSREGSPNAISSLNKEVTLTEQQNGILGELYSSENKYQDSLQNYEHFIVDKPRQHLKKSRKEAGAKIFDENSNSSKSFDDSDSSILAQSNTFQNTSNSNKFENNNPLLNKLTSERLSESTGKVTLEARRHSALSVWQKRQLCIYSRRNEHASQEQLAAWAYKTFRLQRPPSQSTVSRILARSDHFIRILVDTNKNTMRIRAVTPQIASQYPSSPMMAFSDRKTIALNHSHNNSLENDEKSIEIVKSDNFNKNQSYVIRNESSAGYNFLTKFQGNIDSIPPKSSKKNHQNDCSFDMNDNHPNEYFNNKIKDLSKKPIEKCFLPNESILVKPYIPGFTQKCFQSGKSVGFESKIECDSPKTCGPNYHNNVMIDSQNISTPQKNNDGIGFPQYSKVGYCYEFNESSHSLGYQQKQPKCLKKLCNDLLEVLCSTGYRDSDLKHCLTRFSLALQHSGNTN